MTISKPYVSSVMNTPVDSSPYKDFLEKFSNKIRVLFDFRKDKPTVSFMPSACSASLSSKSTFKMTGSTVMRDWGTSDKASVCMV